MKIFLALILCFFALGFNANAQSLDTEDYVKAFVEDEHIYMIDKTSVVYARNGTVLFWGLTLHEDTLFFMSTEIDCNRGLLRLRTIKKAGPDGKVYIKNSISPWMAPNDNVANKYIQKMCGPQM